MNGCFYWEGKKIKTRKNRRQEQLVQRHDGIAELYVYQIFRLFFKLYFVPIVCVPGSTEEKSRVGISVSIPTSYLWLVERK